MSIMISSQEEMQTLGFYDLNNTDGSENSEKLLKMSKGPKKALKIDPLNFPIKWSIIPSEDRNLDILEDDPIHYVAL